MKAWEVLYLVIYMMENKVLKGVWRKGFKENRKEGRDWSRMKGSQAAVGIATQGDEWLLRMASPSFLLFPSLVDKAKKMLSHCYRG